MTAGETLAPFDPLSGGPPGQVREELARLRGGCPVHRAGPGPGFVGRHELVREALLDPGTLSNHGNFVLDADDDGGGGHPELITQSDPPAHTALRALLRPAFTRSAITSAAPWIRAIVDEILDGLPPGGPAEIVGDLAFPLTSRVIARLVGVPAAAGEITRLSQEISDALPAPFVGTPAWTRIEEYFAAAARERRAGPGTDDVIGLLARGRVDGRALEDREVAFHAWQVFVAGLKTTAFTIGSTVAQLLADPGRWAALVADPTLVEGAREEGLRHATALRGVLRTVGAPGDIGGEPVAPGERILLSLESANLDESVFGADAADFVLDRPTARRHLAFGFGIHHCLGAELSRTEISCVLEALVERMPRLAPAPGTRTGDTDGAMFHEPGRVEVVW
ncbi:cytochrome P450 [Pseudonocardia kujensis]|uniref:cytochrome P450 n=1 Tax=Pseudonocardia kujensis TaxID=1128675 RepID=UPI001E31B2E5|nr:cytochrome P450 [Pseudonocardia kujensis]MCE0764222.1 cytochrome P450 [Pseudonocardia kujensis]